MRHSTLFPKKNFAFDLHVLSTPPAFVLSQDQTLQFDILRPLLRAVTYIVLNYIRALSIPVLTNGSLKDALEVIKTSWARLLLLLFSCQGSFQLSTFMKCCAALCREELVNLIYPKPSVNIFFSLSFVPFQFQKTAETLPVSFSLPFTCRTAANYLNHDLLSTTKTIL